MAENEEIQALRQSIYAGARDAVRRALVDTSPGVVSDVWFDGVDREFEGPHVAQECCRINRRIAAALKQLEQEDKRD